MSNLPTGIILCAAGLFAIASPLARAAAGDMSITTYMVDTTGINAAAISAQIPAGHEHDRNLLKALLAKGAVLVSAPTVLTRQGVPATVNFVNSLGVRTSVATAATIPQAGAVDIMAAITRMHSSGDGFEVDIRARLPEGETIEGFKDDRGEEEYFRIFLKASPASAVHPVATAAPPAVPDTLAHNLTVAWNNTTMPVPPPVDLPADFYQSQTYQTWIDVGGTSTLRFPQPRGDSIVVSVAGYRDPAGDPKLPVIVKVQDTLADGNLLASTRYLPTPNVPVEWTHYSSTGAVASRVQVDTASNGTRYVHYIDLYDENGVGVRYEANPYGVAYLEWAILPGGQTGRKLKGSTMLNVAPAH